jgi:predicted metal-dependent hydrolase
VSDSELHGVDPAGFQDGIALFNCGKFYEAHEVLEDVWRAAPAAEKSFLQGLIQIAVALHHYSQGNQAGAKSLLARGERNLAGYPEEYAGVGLRQLRLQIAGWRKALEAGAPAPESLKITFHRRRAETQSSE